MALLWYKKKSDTIYEVRSAGRTRRLYRNGVLHSSYHPERILSGSVWDLLLAPTLLQPAGRPRRVLLLGLGGGMLVHMLHAVCERVRVMAVEIDPVHIALAKRFFFLRSSTLQIVQGDAVEWLGHYRGRRFDVVVEDLFVEKAGQASRLMHGSAPWLKQLARVTKAKGVLIINHGDSREAAFTKASIPFYPHRLSCSLPQLQNRVLAFSNTPFQTREFRTLAKENTLEPRFAKHIRFRSF